MQRSCLLVACVVALGCGGSGGKTRPAPPTTAPANSADTAAPASSPGSPSDDEIRAMLVELTGILDRLSARSTQPCGDVATAINAEADEHREMFERVAKVSGDAEERADRIFESEGYGEKLDRAGAGFFNAIDRCDSDAALHDALERFGKVLGGGAKMAP